MLRIGSKGCGFLCCSDLKQIVGRHTQCKAYPIDIIGINPFAPVEHITEFLLCESRFFCHKSLLQSFLTHNAADVCDNDVHPLTSVINFHNSKTKLNQESCLHFLLYNKFLDLSIEIYQFSGRKVYKYLYFFLYNITKVQET